MGEFYQDLENEKVRVIRDLLQIEDGSNSDILKREQDLDQIQKQSYNDQIRSWINNNTERQFENSYYDRLEARTSFMSPETKEFLKNLSSRRYRILNKYPNKGEVMSDADIVELESIARERKFAKSERNEDGSLKEPGTEEYTISQDLRRADEAFAEENKDKVYTLRQEFIESLTALEGDKTSNKNALKFVISNGGIRFNSDFYDSLGTRSEDGERNKTPRIVQRLLDAEVSEEDSEMIEDLADDIADKLNERQDLLRKHQKTGNPSEIDVSVMTEISKERIKVLDSEIQQAFQQANQILRRNGEQEVTPPQVETENTENESYYTDAVQWGLKPSEFNTIEELDFIAENVSTNDRLEIAKFIKKVSDLRDGATYNIEPKYKRFFTTYFNLDSELTDDEFYDEVVERIPSLPGAIEVAYGKTKLYSYYKRFAPQGYSELYTAIQNGEIAPSRLLNDREALIQEYPAANDPN